jgi:hypothetical protein
LARRTSRPKDVGGIPSARQVLSTSTRHSSSSRASAAYRSSASWRDTGGGLREYVSCSVWRQ